jgi:hypothetical protein
MGACDSGRCCKGYECSNEKKCCCTAGKKGTHAAGEVCRTASCNTGGSCFSNVPVCECLAGGGSLTQACDPCENKPCDKCERCVNGECVSTCSQCQTCDTSSINGTCVDKCTGGGSVAPVTCGQCQSCVCGQCVVTGQLCGSPIVTCCSASECCVNGACVPCDCAGLARPDPCHVCQSGQYVNSCTAAQRCCDGICQECCVNDECPSDKKCVAGKCEPKQCGDYSAGFTIQCFCGLECGTVIANAPGIAIYDGNCYCSGSGAYGADVFNCPLGCVLDQANATPVDLSSGACVRLGLKCCEKYSTGPCIGNLLP